MAESPVGFARHAGEIGVRDSAADERLDHLDRDFGVRPAGKTGDGVVHDRGPGLRHVKAAVAGQPRQHDLDKIERGGLAPG